MGSMNGFGTDIKILLQFLVARVQLVATVYCCFDFDRLGWLHCLAIQILIFLLPPPKKKPSQAEKNPNPKWIYIGLGRRRKNFDFKILNGDLKSNPRSSFPV